uniref:FAD dependent oxidoreductase domain-containing protein n=1 Tax=Globodera rostochiensis TaxID=31243 RepID=A0A914GZJ1_GLORO
MNIAVVGEGVIGTSAALAIRRAFSNSNITVFSDRNFAETTSYGPAGIFRIDLPEASRWAVESFAFWAQLEKHESAHKTGVHLISGYCQSDDKSWLESQERAMAGIVYDWKWLTDRELHALFVKPNSYGVHYSTYAAEGRLYVPWLRAQLVAESAPGLLQFRRQRVDSLQELVDSGQFSLVLNCAGLDGGRLAGDDGTSVYPNRGVGLEVEAPGHAHFTYWGRNVFCIPLVSNGRLLIGTVREDNCWSLEVTARDQQTIWTRFIDLQPNFKDAKIVSSWCGLRPNRHGGVRLEHHLRSKSDGNGGKRVHVIHNYGHNSNGILLSWGCAVEVVRLIEEHVIGKKKSAI